MHKLLFALGVLLFGMCSGLSQDGEETNDLIQQSVAYHDPQGHWGRSRNQLMLREQRVDDERGQTFSQTYLVIDNATDRFQMLATRDGNEIRATIHKNVCTASVNATTDFPEEVEARYGLSCDGIASWRAYYSFLFGLPMQLADAPVEVSAAVVETELQGKPVYAIPLVYTRADGKETWEVYLDRDTRAVAGLRLLEGIDGRDGEYLVFEGEVVQDSVRLPRVRTWYRAADGALIGQDTIESYRYDAGVGGSPSR